MYKKLISPEFRVTLGNFVLESGIEVECFSSKVAKADWCKIELTTQLQNTIHTEDMQEAKVELGYDNDFDVLVDGYVRNTSKDYWKEILIKDDMIKLERKEFMATFMECTPQDVIKYILNLAGIEIYKLDEKKYEKKKVFTIEKKNCLEAIKEVNVAWNIENDFFFQDKVFYWGCVKKQDFIYVLEEDNNILAMKKYNELWEVETLGIPWIHHSQQIEVYHSKYIGRATIEKTIIRSYANGFTRMYIYFK